MCLEYHIELRSSPLWPLSFLPPSLHFPAHSYSSISLTYPPKINELSIFIHPSIHSSIHPLVNALKCILEHIVFIQRQSTVSTCRLYWPWLKLVPTLTSANVSKSSAPYTRPFGCVVTTISLSRVSVTRRLIWPNVSSITVIWMLWTNSTGLHYTMLPLEENWVKIWFDFDKFTSWWLYTQKY